MMKKSMLMVGTLAALSAGSVFADTCEQLKNEGLSHATLKSALAAIVPTAASPLAAATTPNGGLGFPMWLTLVDGSGRVCAVVNSLTSTQSTTSDIWLGSRVISAQKANTANAFSTNLLALSTANLFSAVQPGGSLYGLQASNPVRALPATSVRRTTRWSGIVSVVSMSSAAVWPFMWRATRPAPLAFRAIHPAPTTWSPTKCVPVSSPLAS
jgi:hypothetical protein